MTAIRQKIVWESGMCTQNRGLNNLHRKSLLKISDVYTGFVEIGGRESRRSGIQIVIGYMVILIGRARAVGRVPDLTSYGGTIKLVFNFLLVWFLSTVAVQIYRLDFCLYCYE